MNSLRGWWRGLGGRAKIAVFAVLTILILGLIGSLGGDDEQTAAGPATASPAQATPVVTPTATDQGATPEPTAEPTPEATPEPTLEPTPEPTLEPTPGPAFETITLSGRGDKVARFEIPEDQAAIATITNNGSSNFAVWSLDAGGDETDLLVNEIGDYSGVHLFDVDSHSVAFKITSNGRWKVVIRPITSAKAWDPATSIDGKGASVLQVSPPSSGLTVIDVRHRGRSNFALWSYTFDGRDLQVNEIGRYRGEILLPDGTLLIEIEADGDWSLSPA